MNYRESVQLIIRQKPEHAKVAVGKEKDRKPVDPPPIIQLRISHAQDPHQNYLQSPYFFMSAALLGGTDRDVISGPTGSQVAGTTVSSLHRLKDTDNSDGAFFIWGDLSIKMEGTFRLKFTLFEMRDSEYSFISEIISEPFSVHSPKHFLGMSESTFLTRSFSDQGVRLRLRKEPRTLLRKRGPASDDYQPRTYKTHNRQQSQSEGADRPDPSKHDPSRHNQAESMQASIRTVYEQQQQRPPVGRGQSVGHQSSHSITGSFSDEGPNKRPRTGSEQSSYSQQQPLDSPGYPPRMYSDPQSGYPNPYSAQAQQQQYGYTYAQSPSTESSSTNREQYFNPRLNTQSSISPTYDPSSQRSPQSAFFPSQPHTLRYQQSMPILAPSPTQRVQSTQNAFDGLGLVTRTHIPPTMQASGMGMAPPQQYGRMNTSPSYSSLASQVSRRDMFPEYNSPSQTIMSAPIPGGLIGTRPPSAVATTSAPASMGGEF
ncbi:velvet factor-domain-containing protein [Tricladium varicosporioides]|nr:velvet factor-domain-containing protein [Hymenoscyphus varicosporioides]